MTENSDTFLSTLRSYIPLQIYNAFAPTYHFFVSLIGAIIYRFPSKEIYVIGVTGTKGKTTVTELMNIILETVGKKTALSSTLRFKIGDSSERNFLKMTMPGRFFMQKFLRNSVAEGCEYVIVEMTSEGAAQFRHRFIDLNALIVTNISPEHVESHGSYENYIATKLEIAGSLTRSSKKNLVLVINKDDREAEQFLKLQIPTQLVYGVDDAEPYTVSALGSTFALEDVTIETRMPGVFNIYNMLAAAALARFLGISANSIEQALRTFPGVPGRMEYVEAYDEKGHITHNFQVIVDNAHTKESLEAVYIALGEIPKVCILGSSGGGRDKWKRPLMGGIAAKYCKRIILTDEDPYDEEPFEIVYEIKKGIEHVNRERAAAGEQPSAVEVLLNRENAIREGIGKAREGDAVVITGKGTDPYIMGPKGEKKTWSDADVARKALTDRINNSL